jgi:glycerophosphoryl diester phosphodiesterase
MTEIIGHRVLGKEEVALEDFEEAINLGLQRVEFDLRMTGDNQLVVFHGPRGQEGTPILREKTFAELQRERPMVLFSEAIDICRGKIAFDLEIKERDILSEALYLLDENSDYFISSFLPSVVRQAKSLGAPCGLLLRSRSGLLFPQRRAHATGADFLMPPLALYQLAGRSYYPNAVVWGVRSAEEARPLLRSGVKAIITDDPRGTLSLQRDL